MTDANISRQDEKTKSGKHLPKTEGKRSFLTKRKGFAVAPNEIAGGENGLKPDEVGIWIYLESRPDGWQFSTDRIAAVWGIGYDKTQRILQRLEAVSLLERRPIREGGKFVGYEYLLGYEIQEKLPSPPKSTDGTVPPKTRRRQTPQPKTEGQQTKGPSSLRSSGRKKKESSRAPSEPSRAREPSASPSVPREAGKETFPEPHPSFVSNEKEEPAVGPLEQETLKAGDREPNRETPLETETGEPPEMIDEISDADAYADLERRLGPAGRTRFRGPPVPPGMSIAEHARQLHRQRQQSTACSHT